MENTDVKVAEGKWRLQTVEPREAYLQASPLIDFDHPAIREHLAAFGSNSHSEIDTVREIYAFVRDQVAHSWDIGSRRVTAKASDVLTYREGICYAKSHLLAALLRGQGIPAGICYQKLTLGDTPETGHCIHALNTVYLASLGKWIRLDARGNKPGIDAQFSIDEERLAFPVRPEFGECDYETNFAVPHPKIAATLAAHVDCRTMYAHHLPTDLD
jgi:transglutaminase-like putative cysteine protease